MSVETSGSEAIGWPTLLLLSLNLYIAPIVRTFSMVVKQIVILLIIWSQFRLMRFYSLSSSLPVFLNAASIVIKALSYNCMEDTVLFHKK